MPKLVAAVVIAALSAVLASQALAATRSVKIADDYFVREDGAPTVTVKKGTRVTWRWSQRGLHNVVVTRGPVKFRSDLKSKGTFSRTLRRAGTYRIVCSIHRPDMKMTLRVKR